MADGEKPKQTVVVQGSEVSNENSEQQAIVRTSEAPVGEGIDDEILQQAFEEVSQPIVEHNGIYKDDKGENVTLIADGSVLTDVSGNVVGTINDDGNTYTLSSSLNLPEATLSNNTEIEPDDNLLEDAEGANKLPVPITTAVEELTKSQDILRSELNSGKILQLPTATNSLSSNQPLFVIRSPSNSNTLTDTSSNALSSLIKYSPTTITSLSNQVAPLGSSQNPIRIIQQGNQYTSTQQLNPEQLSQIMQVVQQQQAVRQAKQMGGTSVIYNPETQTKIVYRVINPSDLHTKTPEPSTSTVKTVQVGVSGRTYTGKKRGRKRKIDLKKGDDDTEAPELSHREKEEKKKNRPKTRSGRVSKPPRHMVKDYKQIHLVDWNEDYDDSDGGYSDYKASGDEEENAKRQREEEEDDYEKLRPKRFACKGCDRRYIGSGGLERHWANFPDHKTFSKIAEDVADAEKNDREENPTDAEASNDSFVHSKKDLDAKTVINVDNSSEPGESHSSVANVVGGASGNTDEEKSKDVNAEQGDGRNTPVNNAASKRPWGRNSRRFKLMDLLERCTDEVVLDVALPRLARICSVFQFLLCRVEVEKEALEENQMELEEDEEEEEEGVKIDFRDVYKEYEQLRLKVKDLFTKCKIAQEPPRKCASDGESTEQTQESTETAETLTDGIDVELTDAESAVSLGQTCGIHKIMVELPEDWTAFPGSVSSITKPKLTQEKFLSPGPGSFRKSKPKVYPGAVSVIPPLEADRKPRSLGHSKPMEESEIRAEMLAKRPPASRLKLWVKDENTEDEEDFPFMGREKASDSGHSKMKQVSVKSESANNKGNSVINNEMTSVISACDLQSEVKNNNTKGVSPALPEIVTESKDAADIKSKDNIPSVQSVGNVTTILHSKPMLSVGDTILACTDMPVSSISKSTENTKGTQEVFDPIIPGNDLKNKPVAIKVSDTLDSTLPSDTTSQESFLLKKSSVHNEYGVFVLQKEETSPDNIEDDQVNNGSSIPVTLMNVSDSQDISISTPIETLIPSHDSVDNLCVKDKTVVSLQEKVPATSQSHTTTVRQENSSEEMKYEAFLQDSGPAIKQECDQTAACLDSEMMDIDTGIVVSETSASDKSVLRINSQDHAIYTGVNTFMAESQSVSEAEDSKPQPVHLLEDLTQNNSSLSAPQTTFFESSAPASAVAYHVIGQDTTAITSSDLQVQETTPVLEGVQVIQTGDGIVLVKNPDGTFQIHSPLDQPIPLETVQALLNLTPS